jgi:hypothetical protein
LNHSIMWCHVIQQIGSDASEGLTASIFVAEEWAVKGTMVHGIWNRGLAPKPVSVSVATSNWFSVSYIIYHFSNFDLCNSRQIWQNLLRKTIVLKGTLYCFHCHRWRWWLILCHEDGDSRWCWSIGAHCQSIQSHLRKDLWLTEFCMQTISDLVHSPSSV